MFLKLALLLNFLTRKEILECGVPLIFGGRGQQLNWFELDFLTWNNRGPDNISSVCKSKCFLFLENQHCPKLRTKTYFTCMPAGFIIIEREHFASNWWNLPERGGSRDGKASTLLPPTASSAVWACARQRHVSAQRTCHCTALTFT